VRLRATTIQQPPTDDTLHMATVAPARAGEARRTAGSSNPARGARREPTPRASRGGVRDAVSIGSQRRGTLHTRERRPGLRGGWG